VKFALLSFLLIISACTNKNDRTGTLEISLNGEISTIDPAACYDGICTMPVTQVYESLYEFEYLKRPYSLRPLLADGQPIISADGLTYTFKIKKGIKYHPSDLVKAGREVIAQDFINQIKRLAFLGTTSSRGFWLFDGRIKGLNEWRDKVQTDLNLFFTENVEGLNAPDDNTLVISIKRPYPQLLFAMSMHFTAPIPREAIIATKNDLSSKSIGTGAYVMTSYSSNQGADFTKFKDYASSVYPSEGDRWARENNLLKDAGAKLPFVEKVRLVVIKETQTDWLNFMKKKIDLIVLTKDHFDVALTKEGKLKPEILNDEIKLQSIPTLIYWWIAFNLKDPIVSNINVRKAIAHAANIDKYIQLFTYNVSQKANSIYPPGIPGYDPSSELPYKYDLGIAKEFLAKAGYPDGKGLPKLRFDIRGSDTRRRQMGEFIQQELRQIGIEVEIVINTFPGFLEKARKGELQFWQGGWILDYPDAENVLQLLSEQNLPPGQNYFNYVNKDFERYFQEVRELQDGKRKFDLMKKMEDLVNTELPWIMQFYSRNYVLTHKHLKNYMYSDIIYNNFKYLKLEGK
jgi:oligopeptide transport system substrate-binding protein